MDDFLHMTAPRPLGKRVDPSVHRVQNDPSNFWPSSRILSDLTTLKSKNARLEEENRLLKAELAKLKEK